MKRTNRKKTLTAAAMAVMLLVSLLALPAAAADYDTTGATAFVFSDEGITVTEGSATGYKIDGTALTVNGSGAYVVSGSCADGSITVKKGTTGVVLVLDGLTLTSDDTAPIACNKSSEVTIVAAAGSVNTLIDSERNNDELYPENENAENAVIKCKDGSKVTLCGSGTLNIVANGKNGVKGGATTEDEGEAYLTVKELTLNITAAVNDGLKSDQELNILSGTVTVSAADDGIKSDLLLNIGAEGTDGPTIVVSDSYEGIEAATLNIYSGDITVHAADDGINAANSDLSGYSFSCAICGGTLYVDAGGDGIDSNGTLTLAGGTVQVFSSSQNDNSPLDSDGSFTLSGGAVLAVGSGGMAQTPSTVEQLYVSFGAGGMGGFGGMNGANASAVSIRAGDSISILDADGTVLCSATAVRSASYVFFSSDALTEGAAYTLSVNGSAAATAQASAAAGRSGMPGGMPGQGDMPQPPSGDMPQPPSGDMPQPPSGDMPQPPSGDMPEPPSGDMPQPPSGDMPEPPSGDMPAPPSGDMPEPPSGDMPEPPSGDMPAPPSGNMPAPTFTDVAESDWFHAYVTELAQAGVIDGYPDGCFRPGGTLTWAEAMKLLLCAHEDLADVTGSAWAETAMRKAVALGLCDAGQDGAADITRLDFCKAAAKLFAVSGTAEAFSDCGDADVLALHGTGVIDGFKDGTFRPEGTLTRAQIAKIISLLMQ